MTRRLLIANDNGPASSWSMGAARYQIGKRTQEGMLVVAVDCRVADVGEEVSVLLDTGAEWSIFGGVLASRLLDQTGSLGDSPVSMSTRLGRIRGKYCEVPVMFLADAGEPFEIAATVLLAPEWEGPPVLGYRGLLERIRFALDPGVTDADQWMYFGAVG
jgi:hypothetical protein